MTAFFFYNNELPDVGDIVMCTVTEYTDAGFKVTLNEYADTEGFIALSELSSKRIRKNPATFLKIGDKHPVAVTAVEGLNVDLSLKDVTPDQSEKYSKHYLNVCKLFNMCQRLEHVTDINKNVWHEAFKNTLTENKSLFDAVHNEEILASGQSGLPQELTDALIKNFTKLFGFTITTIQKNVLIQCFRSDGNQYVKDVLLRINHDKEWTREELNQDPERVNISVKLIGLPKILLTVSSNLAQNAESAMQEAMSTLRQANFNILMEY